VIAVSLVVYVVLAVAIWSGARLGLTVWRPGTFSRRDAVFTLVALLFMLYVSRGLSDTTAAQWGWLVAVAATAFAAAGVVLSWPGQRDSTTSRSMSRTSPATSVN
jgi:hypothetical protein